eukprot:2001146-Pleurochrysis_carterae.AAC.2
MEAFSLAHAARGADGGGDRKKRKQRQAPHKHTRLARSLVSLRLAQQPPSQARAERAHCELRVGGFERADFADNGAALRLSTDREREQRCMVMSAPLARARNEGSMRAAHAPLHAAAAMHVLNSHGSGAIQGSAPCRTAERR